MNGGTLAARVVLALLILPLIVLGPQPQAAAQTCDVLDVTCDVKPTSGSGAAVTGFLYVPGETDELEAVAATGNGCAGCVWQVLPKCNGEGAFQPGGQCSGQDAQACDPGQSLYEIILTVDGLRRLFTPVCLGGPGDVVTGAQLDLDAQRYLDRIPVPSPTLSHQPDPLAVVHLPTYVEAAVVAPAPATFGGPDVTMTIAVRPMAWHWDFGDGTQLTTDHDGVRPPAEHPETPPPDAVTHMYDVAGHYQLSASVEWQATYTVTVAGLTLGPYDVTRTLTPPPAVATLAVAEARAELVG